MRLMRATVAAVLALVASSSVVLAAGDAKYHFGFGASLPQGDASNFLDDGWTLSGGATYFRPNTDLGFRIDFGVDWWDVKNDFLQNIDTTPETPLTIDPPDDGDARTWRLGLGLTWEPTRGRDGVGFYATGGLDVHYASYDIGEGAIYGTYYCDWWWGYCYPGYAEGEVIVDSESSWEWGAFAGAGIVIPVGSGLQELYVEALYRWMDTDNAAEWVPVTVGFRW